MKKILQILLALTLILAMFSCSDDGVVENPTETALETETTPEEIIFGEAGKTTEYRLVYNVDVDKSERDVILSIKHAFKDKMDVVLDPLDDYHADDAVKYEIIVNSDRREECAEIKNTLKKNEYAIKTLVTDEKTSIIIAYNGKYAAETAVNEFIENYITSERASIPYSTDIKGEAKPLLIESNIPQLRDPCVLYDDGVYYVYGTGWVCYKNTTGELDSGWDGPHSVVKDPPNVAGDRWAPEVHKYNGAYYMFTTYRSSVTNHRGCTILRSDSPMGPFEEISDGHVTPPDWDAIDGTLYVDPDGQPWMVFVHEWTSMPDSIGSFACAKLSEDLTHFISEPVELFKANAPKWSKNGVTDGCWMYTTEAGTLLMLWSNWDEYGYCVGIARSESGDVTGPWTQESARLYSGFMAEYDGGHGMLFTDEDGQMYLSIHSPNSATDDRREMPVFVPVREEDDTLVWDK